MFRRVFFSRQFIGLSRFRFLSDAPVPPTAGEQELAGILRQKFPNATHIEVADISGGCGAMFEILIEENSFKGLRTVAQHRMVTEALKEQIKDMHGLRITTKVPEIS